MKLIIGLGNPSSQYQSTRHNIGFMVIDQLVRHLSLPQPKLNQKFKAIITQSKQVILAKPQTYMNQSGQAVSQLINFYKIDLSSLIVIHDDLDIKLGEHKLQFDKGPKLHGGVNSIEEKLGSSQFWRLRLGVENRPQTSESHIPGEQYVLQNFTSTELAVVDQVIQSTVDVIQKWVIG